MPGDEVERRQRAFTEEVTSRFGVLPNFFCSAPAAEGLVQELWKFAKAGYLDSPLPSLFKERLFVHLSRFCEVRYCIVRHVGFLIGEGRPSGDRMVLPQTIEEVLTLLRRPFPNAGELADCLGRLETSEPALEMPSPDTQAEGDLFDALTIIFIEPRRSQRARGAVAHAVGERHFEILTAFLAFVRTAHYWTETHPTLAYEPDMLAVMSRHEELAQLLLDSSEAERVKAGDELRRSVADLQEVRNERAKVAEALRVSQERLKTVLAAARMAFWEWNPATDAVSASDTVDELWGLPAGERFESRRHRPGRPCAGLACRGVRERAALDSAGDGDPVVLPADPAPGRPSSRRRALGDDHLHGVRSGVLLARSCAPASSRFRTGRSRLATRSA